MVTALWRKSLLEVTGHTKWPIRTPACPHIAYTHLRVKMVARRATLRVFLRVKSPKSGSQTDIWSGSKCLFLRAFNRYPGQTRSNHGMTRGPASAAVFRPRAPSAAIDRFDTIVLFKCSPLAYAHPLIFHPKIPLLDLIRYL